MNNVILMGRLTKDPELRYINNDQAVARFSIAVDKQLSKDKKQEMESKNQPTVDFINIVVWGKMAENCAKYTAKGKRVLINGRIQTGSYQAKDGSKRYTTDIFANNIQFIDWKDSDNSTNEEKSNNDFGEDFDFGDDFDPSSEDGRIPF